MVESKSASGVAAYQMMDEHQRDPTVKWMMVSGSSNCERVMKGCSCKQMQQQTSMSSTSVDGNKCEIAIARVVSHID